MFVQNPNHSVSGKEASTNKSQNKITVIYSYFCTPTPLVNNWKKCQILILWLTLHIIINKP